MGINVCVLQELSWILKFGCIIVFFLNSGIMLAVLNSEVK